MTPHPPSRRSKNSRRTSSSSSPATQPPPPSMDDFRDWSHLPNLPLCEVLRRLVPSLPSLFAFAATCRPWRRLLCAVASTVLLPRVPPLLLRPPTRTSSSSRLQPVSFLVSHPFPSGLPASLPSLLSFSRGHLLLLVRQRRRSLILLADALTGAERHAFHLPSPHFAYNYAALSPKHLLLFFSRHSFFSIPFPNPNPDPDWTQHPLPRAASFVTGVVAFRGRVFAITDCAQLLQFDLDSDHLDRTAQMLPTTGLPDATAFDRCHFGPQLAAAGEQLLLVLFMLDPYLGGVMHPPRRVRKVSVYGLNMGEMRWEEVENIGEYSLFVDRAGRSAVACTGAGSWGGEANRVYIAASGCRTWKAYPPGYKVAVGGGGKMFDTMLQPRWPSQMWVYPSLLF